MGTRPKNYMSRINETDFHCLCFEFPRGASVFFVGPVHGEAEKDSPRWRSAMRFMFEDMHRKYKRAVTPINVLSL